MTGGGVVQAGRGSTRARRYAVRTDLSIRSVRREGGGAVGMREDAGAGAVGPEAPGKSHGDGEIARRQTQRERSFELGLQLRAGGPLPARRAEKPPLLEGERELETGGLPGAQDPAPRPSVPDFFSVDAQAIARGGDRDRKRERIR